MDETDADPELHDLIIALLTRIGMIMEDASPVALDATLGEVGERVLILANASNQIGALIAAIQSLIRE